MKLRNDRRVERQREAVERNAAWAALTYSQQLASLALRRGDCAKQWKRITAKMGAVSK